MQPVSPEVVLEQLRWRYATKKFDPGRTIPAEDWQTLAEALILTPSSFGLQPWKFWVVTNPEVKAKLLPISYKQTQVVDGSHGAERPRHRHRRDGRDPRCAQRH